jgi:hypothetical protein
MTGSHDASHRDTTRMRTPHYGTHLQVLAKAPSMRRDVLHRPMEPDMVFNKYLSGLYRAKPLDAAAPLTLHVTQRPASDQGASDCHAHANTHDNLFTHLDKRGLEPGRVRVHLLVGVVSSGCVKPEFSEGFTSLLHRFYTCSPI